MAVSALKTSLAALFGLAGSVAATGCFPGPVGVTAGPSVYYEPPPVYYTTPPPVIVTPPRYYYSRPRYYPQRPVIQFNFRGGYHGRGHGGWNHGGHGGHGGWNHGGRGGGHGRHFR